MTLLDSICISTIKSYLDPNPMSTTLVALKPPSSRRQERSIKID